MSAPVEQRGYIGLGTTLEYSEDGGMTWTAIARVTEIGDLSFGEADKVEVTGYDTPGRVREYIKGMEEAADIGITGIWTAHPSQQAIMHLDDVIQWRVTLPHNLGVWEADGYMTGFAINPNIDDRIEWTSTLVVSGTPTLTVGAGDGDGDGDGDGGV